MELVTDTINDAGMLVAGVLRRLRHGPLRGLAPLWLTLGKGYRTFILRFPRDVFVRHYIGPYGPFALHAYFAFSNFSDWGSNHNNGFVSLIESCRGKNCVLDIGGHIGLVALSMSGVISSKGRVYCFEPSAINYAYLLKHINANRVQNIKPMEFLVGSSDGKVIFFEHDRPAGQNSLGGPARDGLEYFPVHRQQVTLDNFCRDHRLSPEIIKIDVEGAETDVIKGARSVLTHHRPKIFLSVHPRKLEDLGSSTKELVTLLTDLDYVCQEIDGSPVEVFQLAEYLILPKESLSVEAE